LKNTLEELWSLLNFCSPAIFDDLRVFQAWFGFRNIGKETQVREVTYIQTLCHHLHFDLQVDEILGNEQQERIVSKLHEILRPFLLRRMKKDVLLTMPPKLEIVVYCGMSNMQREYYSRVQDLTIRESLVAMGIERANEISQLNPIMQLRKVSAIITAWFLLSSSLLRYAITHSYLENQRTKKEDILVHFSVLASGCRADL
jgi:ATP-dependent DNA helicase